MSYYTIMLALKYNFEIVDMNIPDWNTGRGIPDKIIGSQALYYHWKNIPILSSDELDYEYWKIRIYDSTI